MGCCPCNPAKRIRTAARTEMLLSGEGSSYSRRAGFLPRRAPTSGEARPLLELRINVTCGPTMLEITQCRCRKHPGIHLQEGACLAQEVGTLGRNQRHGESKSRFRPNYYIAVGVAVLICLEPGGSGDGTSHESAISATSATSLPTDYPIQPRMSEHDEPRDESGLGLPMRWHQRHAAPHFAFG
jgi:hypothetical protein